MEQLWRAIEQHGWAEWPDADIVTALNAPGPISYRPVPIAELASLAYAMGLPVRLRITLRNPETPVELAAICETLLDLLKAPFATVDFYAADGTPDPSAEEMLGALLDAGLLAVVEADALRGLAVQWELTLAERLLGRAATEGDVTAARAWAEAERQRRERAEQYAALRQRLLNGMQQVLGWLHDLELAEMAVPNWAVVVERL